MVTTFSNENLKTDHYAHNTFFRVFSQFILSKSKMDIYKCPKSVSEKQIEKK
jgi:hypothetical protein